MLVQEIKKLHIARPFRNSSSLDVLMKFCSHWKRCFQILKLWPYSDIVVIDKQCSYYCYMPQAGYSSEFVYKLYNY